MGVQERNRAIRTLENLKETLTGFVEADPEQEVQGAALQALDAVVADARLHAVGDDPVVERLTEIISPESIDAGAPLRCADALLVVDTLLGRLGLIEVEPVLDRFIGGPR